MVPKRNLKCDTQDTTKKEGCHAKKPKVESVYLLFSPGKSQPGYPPQVDVLGV